VAGVNAPAVILFGAQWRMWMNFYARHGQVALVLSLAFWVAWLGGFALLAIVLANALAAPKALAAAAARGYLGLGFLGIFVYWQAMPLVMASIGGLLDWKKLLVYPIPETAFFRLELLFRAVLFLEMPLVILGIAVGLARNPAIPFWAPLAPLLFAVFNLTLGAGIRDWITRLLARKRAREAAVLLFVLLVASPSLLTSRIEKGASFRPVEVAAAIPWLPWGVAARAATHPAEPVPWLLLSALAAGAWAFSRWQFRRQLRFDADAARSEDRSSRSGKRPVLDRWWGWPSRVFPDPLGVLVEKEIRALSRTSRFRVVFFMGFTFGLLIWLPLATGRLGAGGWVANNFLTVISAYSLLLLGEVCFFNVFGFDRAATQMYFAVPVEPGQVLTAKNIAGGFFVAAEIVLITIACGLLRMTITPAMLAETAVVAFYMTLFLIGAGNLISVRSPRGMNPNDGWRRGGGSRASLLMLAVYPLMSLPILLAHLARWAFRTELAFHGVMAAALLVAFCFYWVSLDSARLSMHSRREPFLELLARSDAPPV
jgi:ABC-2 type transport system permease protein